MPSPIRDYEELKLAYALKCAEVEKLRSALKVIHTWAQHDLDFRSGALDAEHVAKLAGAALAAGEGMMKRKTKAEAELVR